MSAFRGEADVTQHGVVMSLLAIIAGIIRNDLLWQFDPRLISQREPLGSKQMSPPQTAYFDANLPGASQTVRIASLFDARYLCVDG
jgi:hypothetical protein